LASQSLLGQLAQQFATPFAGRFLGKFDQVDEARGLDEDSKKTFGAETLF